MLYIRQDLISVDDRTKMIDEYSENDLCQDLFDKGLEKGLRKGVEQGEISILRHLLEKRFKNLPDWVNDKLNQADSVQLKGYLDKALDGDSLEDVFEC